MCIVYTLYNRIITVSTFFCVFNEHFLIFVQYVVYRYGNIDLNAERSAFLHLYISRVQDRCRGGLLQALMDKSLPFVLYRVFLINLLTSYLKNGITYVVLFIIILYFER